MRLDILYPFSHILYTVIRHFVYKFNFTFTKHFFHIHDSPFSSPLPCDAPYNHMPSDSEVHWSPYSGGYAVMISLGKISLALYRPHIIVVLQNTCSLFTFPPDPPVVISTADLDSHRNHFSFCPFLNEKSGKKTGAHLLFIKKLFTDLTI